MASNPKNRETKYYSKDELVKPEDVGVYYFHFPKTKTSKVTVSDIPVNITGFEIESIDKEINAQNDRAMDLYYQLNSN